MGRFIFVIILSISFYANSLVQNNGKINIYQDGIDQQYCTLNGNILVHSNNNLTFPNIVNSDGTLIDKELINFDGRPTFWFSNSSSSGLDSYLTLFISQDKLLVDCVYINSFDNYNGFHQKSSKCGLNLAPFEDENLLESIIYDEKLIEKPKFSFQNLAQETPIKLLVGTLNELKIYRVYASIADYEGDNYYIIINNGSRDFQVDHKIYLRYNIKNQLIGFDLENVIQDNVSIEFYSYDILKKLIDSGINFQNMQTIINIDKVYLRKSPFEKKSENKYLVYADKVKLLDEYHDSKGIIWYKVAFNSNKLGTIITWLDDSNIKFTSKE